MTDNIKLPSWLDRGAATLAGSVPPSNSFAGALPAYTKALSMSPLERLQRIQQSGISECGASGEPIHLAWRQFIRGFGPSTLVIDATTPDIHSQGAATVLEKAPWLLAEGVMIAIGMRDSEKIELLLPAGHNTALAMHVVNLAHLLDGDPLWYACMRAQAHRSQNSYALLSTHICVPLGGGQTYIFCVCVKNALC